MSSYLCQYYFLQQEVLVMAPGIYFIQVDFQVIFIGIKSYGLNSSGSQCGYFRSFLLDLETS